MAEEQFQERTEQATPRKRQKAREEGRVSRSQELNSALIILLGATAVFFLGPILTGKMQGMMIYIFREAPLMNINAESVMAFLSQQTLAFFMALAPILAVLTVVAYGANVLQVGFIFTTHPLELKMDAISPVNGFQRLMSMRSLFQLVRDLLKIAVIVFVAWKAIMSEMDTILVLPDASVSVIGITMGRMALSITLKIGAVLLVLGIIDYAYQKYDFEKNLRMSRQEIRDEYRDTEGSPQIKSRIRQIQRQMSRQRMMQEIPKADVVVTNPTHIAVALKYESDKMDAPMVIAKGERLLAERIKEIARDAGVPIVENKPLARALFKMCDIGAYVPAKLYKAVAEVLAYVYRLKGKEVK